MSLSIIFLNGVKYTKEGEKEGKERIEEKKERKERESHQLPSREKAYHAKRMNGKHRSL